jgi:hypothetical protein
MSPCIYVFSGLSVLSALIAAGFWAWSASISYPEFRNSYTQMVGVDLFLKALRKVARLNALAAGTAFFSAVFMAVTLYWQHPVGWEGLISEICKCFLSSSST